MAWKLERWTEARDLLLLKTPTTGSLNVTHSHSQGNLFPSRKKGNCTFTAWSTAVEHHETEEDSGPKPNGEKEAASSAEEDVGMTGKVGDADPSLGFIACFANAVDLYQKRNCNCFGCGSPEHLVKDCLKEMGKTARKVGLNLKEEMVRKGGWSSQKLVAMQEASLGNALEHKDVSESSLPEPRPTHTLEWDWKHSPGLRSMMRAVELPQTVVPPSMQWLQSSSKLVLWMLVPWTNWYMVLWR